MRNLLTLVAFLLGGIVFSSTYSLATDFPKCRYNGYSWKSDNDKVIVDIKTDGKCHHSFNIGGQWVLQDLQLIKKPSHGTVEIVSVAELNYLPDAKYDGRDNYTIKTCANKGGNTPIGCSTIVYSIDIMHNNF